MKGKEDKPELETGMELDPDPDSPNEEGELEGLVEGADVRGVGSRLDKSVSSGNEVGNSTGGMSTVGRSTGAESSVSK